MPATTITENDILADVLMSDNGDLSPEVARSVLRWKFSHRATSHMNKLARRNQKGTISAIEREELERYLRVGSFINLLQAKARLSLSELEG
jgi:hypothetical protein